MTVSCEISGASKCIAHWMQTHHCYQCITWAGVETCEFICSYSPDVFHQPVLNCVFPEQEEIKKLLFEQEERFAAVAWFIWFLVFFGIIIGTIYRRIYGWDHDLFVSKKNNTSIDTKCTCGSIRYD